MADQFGDVLLPGKIHQENKVSEEQGKTVPMGAGIAIGVAVGVAIGSAMGNMGAGIAIGIAIGAGLGTTLAARSNNSQSNGDG